MNADFIKGLNGQIFINPGYIDEISQAGLDDINNIIDFKGGDNLTKANLSKSRKRIKLRLTANGTVAFLKKYIGTPTDRQIKNWFEHKAFKTTAEFDIQWCDTLNRADISTADVIAWGYKKKFLFEKFSFVILKEIDQADSLERTMPDFISFNARKDFISKLADFTRKLHNTGLRHRDFYLCHIFYNESKSKFTLIDLQRVFRPIVFLKRFQIKDIAQLYYSTPSEIFTKTDRLRFYKQYKNITRLSDADKKFITAVNRKARKMKDHDLKNGKSAGYAI